MSHLVRSKQSNWNKASESKWTQWNLVDLHVCVVSIDCVYSVQSFTCWQIYINYSMIKRRVHLQHVNTQQTHILKQRQSQVNIWVSVCVWPWQPLKSIRILDFYKTRIYDYIASFVFIHFLSTFVFNIVRMWKSFLPTKQSVCIFSCEWFIICLNQFSFWTILVRNL